MKTAAGWSRKRTRRRVGVKKKRDAGGVYGRKRPAVVKVRMRRDKSSALKVEVRPQVRGRDYRRGFAPRR